MARKHALSEKTVETTLDAALRIFGETGSVRVPVARLVELSGVSVGSIYHHFGSADGLSAALYVRCMNGLLDRIIAAIGSETRIDSVIRKLVRAYLGWTSDNRDAARFVHASAFASFIPGRWDEILAGKVARIGVLMEIVQRHVGEGSVAKLPAFMYEILIIGPLAETARRWLTGAPGIDIEAAARLLPERILRGIGG